MHTGHHTNTHKDTLEGALKLGVVVLLDGGGDKLLGGVAGHRGTGLEVLQRRLICRGVSFPSFPVAGVGYGTILLGDLLADQVVQRDDDDVGKNVHGADTVEHVLVLEGDALGDLHHPEDDNEVRAAKGQFPWPLCLSGAGGSHLGIHDCGLRCIPEVWMEMIVDGG